MTKLGGNTTDYRKMKTEKFLIKEYLFALENNIAVDAIGVLVVRVSGTFIQFIFYLLVAKKYGVDGFGKFVLAYTFAALISIVARWGIDQVVLREGSKYYSSGNFNAVKRLFWNAFRLISIISIVISCVYFLFIPILAERVLNNLEYAPILKIFSFAIMPIALVQYGGEFIRAIGRPVLSSVAQTFLVPFFALVLFFICPIEQDIEITSFVYLIATIIAMLIVLFFCFKVISKEKSNIKNREFIFPINILSIATPIAWITILTTWLGFSETIILGIFLNPEDLGLYAAALRLVLLVNFIVVAFNSILAPIISVYYHDKKINELVDIILKTTALKLFMSMPFFILYFIFPELLLSLFGNEFVAASNVLIILAIGVLFNVLTGPVGIILIMTGYVKERRTHVLFSVIINICFAIVLISQYGISGAAISATIGMIVLNATSLSTVFKIYKKIC